MCDAILEETSTRSVIWQVKDNVKLVKLVDDEAV